MTNGETQQNPLNPASPASWDGLIEAVGPASLLLVIESRLSPALRRLTTAEDIFQEALLHAWRDHHRCEWRGIKAFRSWLLSIIDHRIGHLAAQTGTQKRGGNVRITPMSALNGAVSASGRSDDTGFPRPVRSTTPSRIAIFREQAEIMHAALSALPEDMREVVHQRLFEQFTLEEIAERQGLSVSAVRRRFGRGVELYEAALRSALASRSRGAGSPSPSQPKTEPRP